MKPKAVEIYPVYICSDCQCRHSETMEYVKKIGKILCSCGNVMHLTPIETFKVSPVYESSNKVISPEGKLLAKFKPKEDKTYRKRMEEEDDFFEKKSTSKESEIHESAKLSDVFPYEVEKDKNTDQTERSNKQDTKNKYKISQNAFNDTLFFLMKLGWKKRKAKSMVEQLSKDWSEQNSSDIDESNVEEFSTYVLFNHRE